MGMWSSLPLGIGGGGEEGGGREADWGEHPGGVGEICGSVCEVVDWVLFVEKVPRERGVGG